MLNKLNSKKGFTFLELLLSVAAISLLAGLSLPVYRTLIKKNDLDIAATTIASSLRRAQVLSQAVDGDKTWGVKVQSGSIVIFRGSSFAARDADDADFDEIFDLATTIDVDDAPEVIFAKFTGFPETSSVINLSAESDARSISINEKGTITY